MGQIIKNLESLPYMSNVSIELNDSIYGNEKIIHFHINAIRYEMSLSDYLTVLAGVRISKKNLEELKNE